eukprot:c7737_g1_i2.p1 GENE.c7737_g1_i2~~c7737_g1_i2.p1  ORF type:complete len:337 (-),score=96.63 c7737_g1_i2:525-1535(-)
MDLLVCYDSDCEQDLDNDDKEDKDDKDDKYDNPQGLNEAVADNDNNKSASTPPTPTPTAETKQTDHKTAEPSSLKRTKPEAKHPQDAHGTKRTHSQLLECDLPPPPVLSFSKPIPVDDPEKHGGRARIFPHIEGNYATHVFIPLDPSPALEAGIRDVLGHVGAHHGELVRILPPDPIHISLTRTFALRKHQIDPFVRLVRDAVALIPVFSSELSTAKYFHNDSNTRSFVSLCVCRTISNHDNSIYNITNANTNDNAKHYSLLVELIHRLDGALSRFEKPAFYEDPIPHASVAWAVGVAPENIRDLSLTLANPVPFHIDHVVVKCGAKEYSCPLRMQ